MSQLRQLGRALVAPFLGIGRSYNNVAKKWPQSTAIVTTTIKTSAADAFAQLVVERRDELDMRRHAVFCMFGFAYLGCWQFYLYNRLFVRWCAGITKFSGHIGAAPFKTFLDQAVHHPLMYFPTFYMLKGYMEGRGPVESVKKSFEDLWPNLKALWIIWVPAQLVNFAFVPMHLRIPFVAAVSFLWTIVISNMRGQIEAPIRPSDEATKPK